MPFRNGLRRVGRAVIGCSAPGREAPFEVPPVGLRGLSGESKVGIRCLGESTPVASR